MTITSIEGIFNRCGVLHIKSAYNKFYMQMEDNTVHDIVLPWEEISKELYDQLFKYNKKDEVKSNIIFTAITSVDCPYCGSSQEGFMGDPRGGKFTCDDCGKDYKVSEDAEIRL